MKKTKIILTVASLFASAIVFADSQCPMTNLNAWSSLTNPDSRLVVRTVAAMGGSSCGLESAVDFDNQHFVQDDSPVAEQRYRGRIMLDPNSIALPDTGTFRRLKFMNVRCPGPGQGGTCPFRQLIQMKLEKVSPTQFSIDGYVRDGAGLPGNGATKNSFQVDISDAPTTIEWDLNITTGSFRLWIDAASEADTPAVDKTVDLSQWTDGVDSLRIGGLNQPTSVAEGSTIFIDAVETRRSTFIGL